MFSFLIAVTIAYLLGSISSAIIICRIKGLPDPRESGSKNAGATNVLRYADKKIALIILLSDAAKGLLAILIARLLILDEFSLGFVGLAAVLGHIFPLYFNFKGGKGVATTFGVFLGLNWLIALSVLFIWLITAKLFRYSSLAAIVALIGAPLLGLSLTPHLFVPILLISAIIVYKHKDNIVRLSDGTESKIGEEK